MILHDIYYHSLLFICILFVHHEVLEDLKKYRARNGGGGSSILDDLRFQVEELTVLDALRFQGGKLIVLDALRFQGDEIPRQFEQFLI